MARVKISGGTLATLLSGSMFEFENLDPDDETQYFCTPQELKAVFQAGGVAALSLAGLPVNSADLTNLAAIMITASQVTDLAYKKEVNQAVHGFSVLDAVGHDGANWVKAIATISGDECWGVVISVEDANNFTVAVGGIHTVASHGLTLGINYLSETVAGGYTTTPPGVGNKVQQVIRAVDANAIIIEIGESES